MQKSMFVDARLKTMLTSLKKVNMLKVFLATTTKWNLWKLSKKILLALFQKLTLNIKQEP